ncbi:MAG TPA: AhpC/TSA family protein [Bacteroidales bacterium]|nr:AhpC/TSA family protein [Bacteroidales bacterium]
MKRIVFAAIVLLTFACSPKKQDGFVINGTIKDLKQKEAYLVTYKDGMAVKLDSSSVDTLKGTFILKGKVETPDLMYITFSDDSEIELFIENSTITVTGDSVQNARITGSVSNDLYTSYKEKRDSVEQSFKSQEAEYDSVLVKYKAARKAGKDAEAKSYYEQMAKIEEAPEAAMREFNLNFIKNHPSSYVAPAVLWNELAWGMDAPEMEPLVNAFDTTIGNSSYITRLKDRIEILKKVAVGSQAPDFTMNDSLGNPHTLSSYYGKVLLVDFWASWCGPCRRENPNIVAVYKQFHKKGFDILGVSFDKNKASWTKAILDDKLTWNHVSDLQGWGNAAGKLYGIRSIPSNMLLDEKGTIIAKNLMGDDLTNKLKELLK